MDLGSERKENDQSAGRDCMTASMKSNLVIAVCWQSPLDVVQVLRNEL